jgi:hypothetical protein
VATAAHAGDAAVEAPIRQFVQALNKGDVAGIKAAHVAAPSVIDEVAPHYWAGPGAIDAWLAALAKSEASAGETDGKLSLGTPSREVVSAGYAYVIFPATYTFNRHAAPMSEPAQWTFALARQNKTWKIAAWSWTGPAARPAH